MYRKLIPSVENRASTWMELLKKKKEETKQTAKTITLSRDFGCEGFPLAEELKQLLDTKTGQEWMIFDKALINKILEDKNLSRHVLEHFGERSNFMDNLASMIMPDWGTEASAYEVITETIYKIAKEGNAIIIGRGAFVITQDLPNCYHFHLGAPLEFRVNSLAKRLGIPPEEAEKMIKVEGGKRTKFINRFLTCNSQSPDLFHAAFNNSKASVDHIARLIIGYMDF